jgi:hypothetical protein
VHRTARRLAVFVIVLCLIASRAAPGAAQRLSVGAGVLLSDRPSEPTYNIHLDSPPLFKTRAELTLSWNDERGQPTVITEAERSFIDSRYLALDAGAGLLWLEFNDYRPYPILISTAVVPLPLPRTAIVAVGSTQPWQDWDWSLVLKASFMIWARH